MAPHSALLIALLALAAAAAAVQELAIVVRSDAGATDADRDASAEATAARLGARVLRRIGRVPGAYLLELPDSDPHHHERRARDLPDVAYAAIQKPVTREKRDAGATGFRDPLYPAQWHLHGYPSINVEGAWQKGLAGDGVLVAVVDDGLYHWNPDFGSNYCAECSFDFNRWRADPSPLPGESHGTRCAGEIAAAANTACGVGVAYRARVAGVRVLGGTVTDALEAEALNHCLDSAAPSHIAIYSNSWGPPDDGETVEGPEMLAQSALEFGARAGRGGRGAIYIWAAGNGGQKDNCNMDGFANSPFTVTVGALADNDRAAYYQEPCPAMLTVAYSSGGTRAIATTDAPSGCTASHGGTSAAAPLVAGVVALMLQARPELTSRDVQWVLALTARKVLPAMEGVKPNAFGLSFHPLYGFGVVDAAAAAALASTVPLVAPEAVYLIEGRAEDTEAAVAGSPVTASITTDAQSQGLPSLIEHVRVTVSLAATRRGDVSLHLVSPSGTEVELLSERPKDDAHNGLTGWTLSTVAMWGEGAAGVWSLRLSVRAGSATLHSWTLEVRGVSQEARL